MSELLELTKKTLSDKLAERIAIIDMRNVNPFADYYVICTARNLRHVAALAKDISDEAEKNGFHVRIQEGSDGSNWILVDLYELSVHIFTEDARSTYKLENLWGDLPVEYYVDPRDTEKA